MFDKFSAASKFTPAVRRSIYGVVASLLSLAVAAGVIDNQLVPLILAGVAGVLGLGLAYKHVNPTPPEDK